MAHFDNKHRLGEGTFGMAHKALDNNGEFVVIKTMLQEAEIKFIGSSIEDGMICRAMEYFEAGTVLDLTKSTCQNQGTQQTQRLAQESLRGVAYLHSECLLVHRDIKACNALLNHRGHYKLGTFEHAYIIAHCTPLAQPTSE